MNSKQSLGDPTLRVADAPHLRSVPHSRTKPRPISLFPIPHSESPLSPLIPSFRSPSRLSTSPDRLSRTDPQPPSPDIETAIGLPPKYTLQLNLPGDCSSLLILSEYGFGISDEDSDTRKVQDKSYSPASSSPTNTTASARRRSKDTLPSPIENSPGVASQAPHDPPPGQRLSSSYFNFDTDSSDSDATQIVVVHRRLTTSTNSSKTGKKRGSRPSTPRSIHPPARSSRNFIRSPYQPRRPNSRNSPSLHLRTSTQCSHSRQSSRQAHDVASILDSLSPARPLVPPTKPFLSTRHLLQKSRLYIFREEKKSHFPVFSYFEFLQ
ncbi:hypothetical protein M413DRAFT_448022 [Hebeloma cylindrosporum]|uniref:Uncharacterized protein n=1 Tax=Hebeloma cylindrosporum TaxID=76867 RepID=A0A0C3BNP6_HEBCY|nr:hypothetical protein M413DRAFT_448022 [Hebeloma cylindrosporum h7]